MAALSNKQSGIIGSDAHRQPISVFFVGRSLYRGFSRSLYTEFYGREEKVGGLSSEYFHVESTPSLSSPPPPQPPTHTGVIGDSGQ
eukprot:scaffold172642_cov79-Cyclotella_meneghiniana.AAC.3